MARISAYFHGWPGDGLDKIAQRIFEEHGGQFVGAGTNLAGVSARERDVEYQVPGDRAEECRAALKEAGFRLEPMTAGASR